MLVSKVMAGSLEREILGMLQSRFPLVREPYDDLGLELGVSGAAVIKSIRELKESGLVREIGPVMNARRLGYATTLVALKIPHKAMEEAAEFIKSHQGISHAYERTHQFNVWVTFAARNGRQLQKGLEELCSRSSAEAMLSLPAARTFKLRTEFVRSDAPLEYEGCPQDETKNHCKVVLSGAQRAIINAIQRDLPLTAEPFQLFADELGIDVDTLLSRVSSLVKKGLIRRYGASINHCKVGFGANAMTCWVVPPGQIEGVAGRLASLASVSHCYERETCPAWRYNVFAMMHGNSRDECLRSVQTISSETGIADYAVLFSTRELKKRRILYPV
jgi:siroheme decarboxylase